MKLFKVTIRNGKYAYVVAKDPTSAYKEYRKFLDSEAWYFSGDREMQDITLMADEDKYGAVGKLLIFRQRISEV